MILSLKGWININTKSYHSKTLILIVAILVAVMTLLCFMMPCCNDKPYVYINKSCSNDRGTVTVERAFGDQYTAFVVVKTSRSHEEYEAASYVGSSKNDMVDELFVRGFDGGYQFWRLHTDEDETTQYYLVRMNSQKDNINRKRISLVMTPGDNCSLKLKELFGKERGFCFTMQYSPFSETIDISATSNTISNVTLYNGLLAIEPKEGANREAFESVVALTESGESILPFATNQNEIAKFSKTIYFLYKDNSVKDIKSIVVGNEVINLKINN